MKTPTAPKARDVMHARVHTVKPEMHLGDVVTFLLEHEVSNAPVVRDEGNKRVLLGFISESDCLEFLANEMFYGNPTPPQIAETIMKKHPVCVGPDSDLFTLTSIFTSHRYRHLPVVEEDCLLGIVSRRDILRSLDDHYRKWLQTKDRQRFPVDVHQIMNHRFLGTR